MTIDHICKTDGCGDEVQPDKDYCERCNMQRYIEKQAARIKELEKKFELCTCNQQG